MIDLLERWWCNVTSANHFNLILFFIFPFFSINSWQQIDKYKKLWLPFIWGSILNFSVNSKISFSKCRWCYILFLFFHHNKRKYLIRTKKIVFKSLKKKGSLVQKTKTRWRFKFDILPKLLTEEVTIQNQQTGNIPLMFTEIFHIFEIWFRAPLLRQCG